MHIISGVYLHIILRVEEGKKAILPSWEEILFEFIKAKLKHHDQKVIAINAHLDHLHILVNMNVNTSLDEVIAMIKTASKEFAVNQNEVCAIPWAEDYVCLSIGGTQLEDVTRYIRKQQELHLNISLAQEIEDLMDQTESDIPLSILRACGFMINPQDYSLN